MNQREAAKIAGISQSNWSKIENAEHEPTLGQVLRIQYALGGQGLDDLFGPGPAAQVVGQRPGNGWG